MDWLENIGMGIATNEIYSVLDTEGIPYQAINPVQHED